MLPKSIVAAVPTTAPESLISTPVPVAVILVNPEPSPTKFVAVTTPITLTSPVTLRALSGYSELIPTLVLV